MKARRALLILLRGEEPSLNRMVISPRAERVLRKNAGERVP